MNWLNRLDAVPTIRLFRQSFDQVVETEVERAQKKLAAGADSSEVVRQLANSLSRKFTHNPTEQLARNDGDGSLSEAVRRLFKLEQ